MTIKLICVGKIRERYLDQAINEYRKRLRRYVAVDYQELKAEKRGKSASDVVIKKREADRIQKRITPRDFVIALDETGRQYSSTEFADFLARCQRHGEIKTLVFITGGATGFPKTFLSQADKVLSLSKMTFPHQFCRLILLEQLYRAYTIIAGESYHKI